jgi:hypothetical protein
MTFNALILNWTMDDYPSLKRDLRRAGFAYLRETDSDHIRAAVPYERLTEFAALCQRHFNAAFNYIDLQYAAQRKTVLVFRDAIFTITNGSDNEQAKKQALRLGLPPQHARWATSF